MFNSFKNITIAATIALSSSIAFAQEEAEIDIEIKPIPREVEVNEAKVKLGEMLYHDKMLSADGTVACASCHVLDKGGVDRLKTSEGIKGQLGPINSPTVYNSSHNFVQFWDGRAANLAEQALGPVENPKEMGDIWENVVKKIADNPEYAESFKAIYNGEITKENAADAIAEFERTLITPDSRFDDFLRGDEKALTELEKKGWDLFQEKGCNSCHNGINLGGNSYQMMAEEYFADRGGEITEADLGRFNVTKDEGDKHSFKVPTLRNVEVTYPYFHDGEVKTLEDAVTKMAKYQLGEDLSEDEVEAITAFLKTLTGKYKGEYLK